MTELNELELENVSGGAPGAYSGPVFRYTIQPKDCLSVLAQQYHTTVDILLQLNPQITNPNLIYAGRTMLIPYRK